MKIAILLMMTAAACSLTESATPTQLDPEQSVQACGSKLNTLISSVCKGQYCSPKKKSHQSNGLVNPYWKQSQPQQQVTANSDLSVLSGTALESLVPDSLRRQKRHKAGIVTECCYKPCTVSHVQQYCNC